MTIVEVMVAFVLVLLAIAMITTAASMATKIQKNTQENQTRAAYLAELAYQKLQPNYDETEKRWKIAIPSSELSNISAATQLHFTGNGTSFAVDVKTADWTVEANLESAGAIRTKYYIYQSLPKSEAGNPVVPGEQHRSKLDAYVVVDSVRTDGAAGADGYPYYLEFHVPPLFENEEYKQDCDQWRLHMPALVNAAEIDITGDANFYGVEYEGNDIIIKNKGKGWNPNEKVFGIKFKLDLELTAEQMKELEHTKYVEQAPSYEYASSSNIKNLSCNVREDGSQYMAEIYYEMTAGEKRIREYLKLTFKTEITGFTGPNMEFVQPVNDKNTLYVYGQLLEKGQSMNTNLYVYLKEPSEPEITFWE